MEFEYTPDQGPAEHFQGRETIINDFKRVLNRHQSKKDGTTFLIQGAPGAGKTALLYKLSEEAEKNEWKTVNLFPTALWEPEDLLHCLGRKRGKVARFSGSIGMGADGIGHANDGIAVKRVLTSVLRILQDGQTPLLLVLDEAQTLGLKDIVPPEVKAVVTNVLGCIHNGRLGRPAVLLAAGLGTTSMGFKSVGISRFNDMCDVPLGSLSHDSTCAVIEAFIKEKGGLRIPPPRWVETIAAHTHGWPQHIIGYASTAAEYLAAHGVSMDNGLEFVLQQGRAKQLRYCEKRAQGINKKKRQILARFFSDIPLNDTVDANDIKNAIKEEYSDEVAEELFNHALMQGIIDEDRDGDYGIPIASMHTWLVEEYAKDKLKD